MKLTLRRLCRFCYGLCLAALPVLAAFVLTACSYVGYLELRGDVVEIQLIHYDNPNVGPARNFLGLASGPGRYRDFDNEMVQILEHLDTAQFESFLEAVYDEEFFGHVAARPNAPNGLIVLVMYETGEFDVISSAFTANYRADGGFESYVASWWGIERVIYQHFETDITRFLGRTPPTISDFNRVMRTAGFEVYSVDMSGHRTIRRIERAYFPPHHSEAGNYIEFTAFRGTGRTPSGFEALRTEILGGIGRNHTITEERISNYRTFHVSTRGNTSRIHMVGDVMVSARLVNEEYSEWLDGILESLFPARALPIAN